MRKAISGLTARWRLCRFRPLNRPMTNWRVLLLSGLGCLLILAGLVVLALPDSYEGLVLYSLDSTHAIRVLDVVGLAMVVVGGTAAWGAGWVWQRWIAAQ